MILPSSLPRKMCSVFAALTVLLVFSSRLTAAAPAAAPGGPTVTLKEPVAVTVTGPVEVQGYVEVLNDALKTAFNKRLIGQMPANTINALVSLPAIPAGKRLVIEAIGVTALVAANTKATAFLTANGVSDTSNAMAIPLPLTSQGAFGLFPREHYMGLHKVRIVIDPRYVNGAQFNVFRSGIGDIAEVTCTIIGYLEDIPATP
jgi:hypothetical protein